MSPKALLYLLGGLAGVVLGSGVSLHLTRLAELSGWLGIPITLVFVLVFVGMAHMLCRSLLTEEDEPVVAAPVIRSSQPWGWLLPQNPTQMGYPLHKKCVLIGRDVDNDIMINSGSISRTHAQLVCIDSEYVLHDLDSRNGTYVNGERIIQRVVHNGDVLTMGEVGFVLRLNEPGTRVDTPSMRRMGREGGHSRERTPRSTSETGDLRAPRGGASYDVPKSREYHPFHDVVPPPDDPRRTEAPPSAGPPILGDTWPGGSPPPQQRPPNDRDRR